MSEPSPLVIAKILVPLDFGDSSLNALRYAKGLAERFGSALQLLHVVPNPYVPNVYLPMPLPTGFLDDLVRDAGKRMDELLPAAEREALRASTFVKVGDARAGILDQAAEEKVDLIVMGTHGRKGAAHLFLGSVAENVLRVAPCPVLVVR